jgi:LacI family transcriptional regulator, galactose operon repressor
MASAGPPAKLRIMAALSPPAPRRRNGIREVAAAAGVSVGTVSNVLNSPDLVSAGTREKVGRAMRELGFVRNGLAHQLRAGSGSAVGVVLPDMANQFWTEVGRGAEDVLTAHDLMMFLCSTDGDDGRQSRYLSLLEEHGVRGVLVAPAQADLARLGELSNRGTPVVLLDRPSPTRDMCSVSVDDAMGGRLAAEHLIAAGHRRMALLTGPSSIRQCRDRGAGFRHAMVAAGLDPHTHLREEVTSGGEVTFAEVDDRLEKVLREPDRPTAIACVSDVVALAALRGLRARGIRVPADIALIGYDDLPYTSELDPPLTTIRQPRRELGAAAVELLLAEADAGHEHRQIVFTPELVVRGSTR